MPEPTLFDVPAEGEMFDVRPYEAPMAAVSLEELPVPASWRCPSCGRDAVCLGTICPRCESAGHHPMTMDEIGS